MSVTIKVDASRLQQTNVFAGGPVRAEGTVLDGAGEIPRAVGGATQGPLGRLTFKPGLGDTHLNTEKEIGTLRPQDLASLRLAA